MKRALVSGSSKGIGKGIAEKLIEEGYAVYVNGRNAEQVNETVKVLGPQAFPLVGDFTKVSEIDSAHELIRHKAEKIDLLVLNIGSGKSVAGADVTIEEFRRIFDINFFAAVGLTQSFLDLMAENSSIIFISSIAGVESIGAPMPYNAAKAALLAYMKSLSDLLASRNIRVNSVSPGNVMFSGSTWDEKLKANKDKIETFLKEKVPLSRFAKVEEIADAVVFLSKSEFITGHNLIVDGGQVRKFC